MASTDSLKKGEQRSIIVMSIHFLIFLQRKNNISGTCDMRMLASKNAVLTSDVLFSQLTVKYQDNNLSTQCLQVGGTTLHLYILHSACQCYISEK